MPRTKSIPISRVCGLCGKSFLFRNYPCDRNRSNSGRFCSLKCASLSTKVPLDVRFHQTPVTETDSGCLLWNGHIHKGKYGTIGSGRPGHSFLAHRVAWEIKNGLIPDGLFVCHHCDTPACVNVDHLFLGTHTDNMADMRVKGRSGRTAGETNGCAKLTASNVAEIRRRYVRRRVTLGQLAHEFGVSESMISMIVRREKWKHV